jgi:hypothetical protein
MDLVSKNHPAFLRNYGSIETAFSKSLLKRNEFQHTHRRSLFRELRLLCLSSRLSLERSNRHTVSKDFAPCIDTVSNAGEGRRNKWGDPIHEIMFFFRRHFVGSPNTKSIPGSCQHGVHCGSSSGEKFNEGADSNCRQELLDNVVVFAKVHFPVQLHTKKKS